MANTENIDPSRHWDTILILMEQARWNNAETMQQAYTDLALAWANEADRELLVSATSLFGLISSFTGNAIWTLADALQHEQLLLEKKNSHIVTLETEESSVQVKTDLEAATKAWHEAVEGKRANLSQSKLFRDQKIREAKDAHVLLTQQWEEYVIATRETLRRIRGS